jgi:hypothetical protein
LCSGSVVAGNLTEAKRLFSRFPVQPIALAVEQSRGALVFMLSKYEYLHIYPIHPRAAAQFRAALYPSGAKDDPIDANLLLDLLVHHRGHLRRLSPDTEQTGWYISWWRSGARW